MCPQGQKFISFTPSFSQFINLTTRHGRSLRYEIKKLDILKTTDKLFEDPGNELKNQPKKLSGVTLARVHLLATRTIGRLLRESGIQEISPEQARILNILWRVNVTGVPPISIGILARETQLSKPTSTIMLNRLEKKGYIKRFPSETDRRVVFIKSTGKDKHLEKLYANVADIMSEIFYKGFSPKEVEQFENCLERILNNLIENSHGKHS
jgi:DNA-binding MarR family transcriptional regulator